MSDFDRLHPSLQHHVVNSLGWKQLRPVQERCIGPVLDGQSVLVLAPTAGGKTEAAVFPLLSRMLSEGWAGLSVLYVCPIKALLNNLHARLEHYCSLVGRRCGLWHGDTSDGARKSIVSDPPDVLLTTPESLEVLLVHRHRKHPRLLAGIRAVVVDELHAFAGDDRGWHLLSVLARVGVIAGRPLQRVGLSATVGNAPELLGWLAAGTDGKVIDGSGGPGAQPEVQLDYVGSLENAATVIAALHQGEKRLVFCDSRSRVEQLARILRDRGVETFVSHSSLSSDERKQAEAAFAGRSNCVIVATSTLELGIDVGDLDRVIQIDAPSTVASFLQRIGRTGRRPGTRRNCLFLATDEDTLVRAAGLIRLWSDGYVEPVRPPALPLHIFAQQVMALCLQENGLPRDRWRHWIGTVPAFAEAPADRLEGVIDHMLARGLLSDQDGLLWIGDEGEQTFGRRHFMELLSSFTAPPLFRVLHGQKEVGLVDPISFTVRQEQKPVILLAGRGWQVTHLDWDARVAFVVPSELKGRSQWMGAGPPLSFELCQAVRQMLSSDDADPRFSRRANEAIAGERERMPWCRVGRTVVVPSGQEECHWWTFAGLRANASLAAAFAAEGARSTPDNLLVEVRADAATLQGGLMDRVRGASPDAWPLSLVERAIEGLKFSECLPDEAAVELLRLRSADRPGVLRVLAERLVYST